MKKEVFTDLRAQKELEKFSTDVQDEFRSYFNILEKEGKLEYPEGKKITDRLLEIRISYQGQYRGFYAYLKSNSIVVLHVFRKKSQKTPLKNLRVAERRLKSYE